MTDNYGHNHRHNGLIWGEDIHDFSILGRPIWGRGLSRGAGGTDKGACRGLKTQARATKRLG